LRATHGLWERIYFRGYGRFCLFLLFKYSKLWLVLSTTEIEFPTNNAFGVKRSSKDRRLCANMAFLSSCATRLAAESVQHAAKARLHKDRQFGRLFRMHRFLLQAVIATFSCALFVADATADDEWVFAPAPAPDANAMGSADAKAIWAQPQFRSSASSKSAWINQGDWLFDRLSNRGLRIGDPVHIRIFKQSRQLELYLQGREGFELYRTYPICDVSGMLGPKRFEGDLQAPEGFYTVVPERLHPHSDFHLAFNLGYPNEFDRSMGRTGSNIMIHGGCASNGCFAMTDYYMEQIYLLAEAALKNGQHEIGVEIYPFRMTEENLTAHAASRWIEFWRSLKPVHDHFAGSGYPARITIQPDGYRLADSERGNGQPSAAQTASAP